MAAQFCGTGPLLVSETLRVLNNAVQEFCASSAVWYKESGQKNLKRRDFLVPKEALKKSFPDGVIPLDLILKVFLLNGPGFPPLKSCTSTEAGIVIQLDRPAVFHHVLRDITPYLKPLSSVDDGPDIIILNCAPLHSTTTLDTVRLSHLRAALLADHLAEVLTLKGKQVYLVPATLSKEVQAFLSQLGISWPCTVDVSSLEETVTHFKDYLTDYVKNDRDVDSPQSPGLFSVQLKTFAEKHNLCLQGYDPNLDFFLVNEDDLRQLASLQHSVLESDQGTFCTVIHIVSCEEEFQQQKLDLLWRLVSPCTENVTQKHLICGPVKVLNSILPFSGSQYFQFRKSQMLEASIMRYRDNVEAGESWDNMIMSLTTAAVKFELMATPHRSQVNLNLEDGNITTKGTKSGAFVMYNCARLATLFSFYTGAVYNDMYPNLPPAATLNYSNLFEEGEWRLLFNYIMMLPEVLSQSAQISLKSPGIRITANTEAVCKFLINLSMDFSSYYNRVHILGESLPHLYSIMFARLQLMKAVQAVLHSALNTLHLRPLNHV